MVRKNPQNIQDPALILYKPITYGDYIETYKENKPTQIMVFKMHVSRKLPFQFCFENAWIKNISGIYEATSKINFFYAIYVSSDIYHSVFHIIISKRIAKCDNMRFNII